MGEVAFQSSGAIPEGAVIDQHPRAGTPVARGTPVDLEVSSGSPFAPKRVPSLIGLDIAVVEDTLRKYEMSLGSLEERLDNRVPPGQVLRQSPAADTRAPKGTKISLVISMAATPLEWPGSAPDSTGRDGRL